MVLEVVWTILLGANYNTAQNSAKKNDITQSINITEELHYLCSILLPYLWKNNAMENVGGKILIVGDVYNLL